MRLLITLIKLPFLLLGYLAWLIAALLEVVFGRIPVIGPVVHILSFPFRALALLAGARGQGRDLDDEFIRPTFSLPWVFSRGPWRPASEQDQDSAVFELPGDDGVPRATMRFRISRLGSQEEDPSMAEALEAARKEDPLPGGMRWAGLRVTTMEGADAGLQVIYVVWRPGEKDSCIEAVFEGAPEHEAVADAFITSVLPDAPAVVEPGLSA